MSDIVYFKRSLVLFAALLLAFAAGPGSAQQLVWQAPSPASQSFLVAPDGNVFIADGTGMLRDFSPDGHVNWSYTLGSPIVGAPVFTGDGGMVVATQDSRLVSVSAAGKKSWEAALPAIATGAPIVTADGSIVVGAGTKLLAFTPAGAPKWTYDNQDPLINSPAAGASGIAIGAQVGGVYLVDNSGNLIYNFAVSDSIPQVLAVAAGKIVTYLAGDQQIVGLDATGNQAWVLTPADTTRPYSVGLSTAHDGILYVVVGGSMIQAITPDGKISWSYDAGSTLSAPLTLTADNRLLFGTSDQRIVNLDLQGKKLGETKIPEAPIGVGEAANGRLYAVLGVSGAPGLGASDLLAAISPPDTTPPLWTPSGLSGLQVLAMVKSPADPHTFYASGDKTVAVSTDDGKTWKTSSVTAPAGDTAVHHLAMASDGSIYAVTQNFLYYSAAGGGSFGIEIRADDFGPAAADPKDPAHVVYGHTMNPLLTDGTMNGSNGNDEAAPTVFSNLLWTTDGTLYGSATDGLYRRLKGADWTKAADGLTTGFAATDDGKVIYVGGDQRLLRSADGGATFTELGKDRFVGTVYRVAASPVDGSEVVVGTVLPAAPLSNASIRGINLLHSTDSGATWTVMDRGLTSVAPHALVAGNGFFLMGTDDGVWRIDAAGGGKPTVLLGDLNNDGKVNVIDATIALEIAVKLIKPTPEQIAAGDVAPPNAPDGSIDISDVTRILRVAVGLEKF